LDRTSRGDIAKYFSVEVICEKAVPFSPWPTSGVIFGLIVEKTGLFGFEQG